MQLSKFTDYSLRVLMYVGARGEQLSTIGEVAEAYDVSHHHLVKVVRRLVELDLLHAVRGRGGGMQLAREPAEITVGEVVRATENLDLVECMGEQSTCVLSDGCQLQRALANAREAFLQVLDDASLADLLKPRTVLRSRLFA